MPAHFVYRRSPQLGGKRGPKTRSWVHRRTDASLPSRSCMPLRKFHPPTFRPRVLGAAAVVAATAFTAPAGASAATLSQNLTCQAQVVTSPFKAFGDTASYF